MAKENCFFEKDSFYDSVLCVPEICTQDCQIAFSIAMPQMLKIKWNIFKQRFTIKYTISQRFQTDKTFDLDAYRNYFRFFNISHKHNATTKPSRLNVTEMWQ